MASISDMIVAKGSGEFRKGNSKEDGEGSGGLFNSSSLCNEEMIETLKQITPGLKVFF